MPSAAELLEHIWGELSGLLGTAATAALLRRAAVRAARNGAALDDFEVRREGLGYVRRIPERWLDAEAPRGMQALRALTDELHPLLVELTGQIVIRRLRSVTDLSQSELFAGGTAP